ncbi:MAG: motility protein A [Clostridiaceae bacterium]
MDLATVIGITFGTFCLVVSILLSGKLQSFFDVPSIFITVGGGLASTLIQYKLKDFLKIFKLIGLAFLNKSANALDTIALMVKLSEKTRREGLLAIESELEQIEDPFIRRSLQLVVDGVESETIKDYMNMEISNLESRHSTGIAIFKSLASEFPAWGLIGTLIGLVLMLRSLDDPSTIGPSMAVSLITTFYGSVLANFICIPVAEKLQRNSDNEVHIKEMVAEAVISIQAGENPKMMEHKLRVFLSPDERDAEIKKDTSETKEEVIK